MPQQRALQDAGPSAPLPLPTQRHVAVYSCTMQARRVGSGHVSLIACMSYPPCPINESSACCCLSVKPDLSMMNSAPAASQQARPACALHSLIRPHGRWSPAARTTPSPSRGQGSGCTTRRSFCRGRPLETQSRLHTNGSHSRTTSR